MQDHNTSRPTYQYMLLQNRAYHEDNLVHTKPRLDNQLRDYAHITDITMPSKKNYLWKEKTKEIENGNLRLLSKIYTIIFDKKKQFPTKYNQFSKEPKDLHNTTMPLFHPYSIDSRVRSLNIVNRKKETDRINKENHNLLSKLKDSKPTVFQAKSVKQRVRNLKNLNNLTRKYEGATDPLKCILPNPANAPINPTIERYLKKHEIIPMREFSDLNNLENIEHIGGGSTPPTRSGFRRDQRRKSELNSSVASNASASSDKNVFKPSRPVTKMQLVRPIKSRGNRGGSRKHNNSALAGAIQNDLNELERISSSMEKIDSIEKFNQLREMRDSHLADEIKKIEDSYVIDEQKE